MTYPFRMFDALNRMAQSQSPGRPAPADRALFPYRLSRFDPLWTDNKNFDVRVTGLNAGNDGHFIFFHVLSHVDRTARRFRVDEVTDQIEPA